MASLVTIKSVNLVGCNYVHNSGEYSMLGVMSWQRILSRNSGLGDCQRIKMWHPLNIPLYHLDTIICVKHNNHLNSTRRLHSCSLPLFLSQRIYFAEQRGSWLSYLESCLCIKWLTICRSLSVIRLTLIWRHLHLLTRRAENYGLNYSEFKNLHCDALFFLSCINYE